MGEIIALRPHANNNEIEKPRWIAKQAGGSSWIVADTYCQGDFCGWFETQIEAEAECRRRNVLGSGIIGGDDDIPF